MGIRTPNKLVAGMRTRNKLAAGIRTPDKLHTFGMEPPPPPMETAAQAATRIMAALGVAGGHVVDVTFSDHNNRKWQEGIDGTRHDQYPADMFTNDAIFRMFRLRVSGNPTSINVWRGAASTYSYEDSATPLQSGNWFYVINCDDREWLAMPISGLQTLAESSFAFTNNIDLSTIRTNATVSQVTAWVDALELKRVIIAVSNQATYDPFAA